MSLWGIILLTSVVVILAVVPAVKANLLALHVKGICLAVLLLGPACVFTESWVRPHLVVLDVCLKVTNVLGPRFIAAVLLRLVLSKLLLLLGGFDGFSVRLALPHQENQVFLSRFCIIRLARGELGFSRFKFGG